MIDGFDPDKFRKVNKTNKAAAATSSNHPGFAASNATSAASASRSLDMSAALPPGAVPTYDRSEQQLLASLEQELGVI